MPQLEVPLVLLKDSMELSNLGLESLAEVFDCLVVLELCEL